MKNAKRKIVNAEEILITVRFVKEDKPFCKCRQVSKG